MALYKINKIFLENFKSYQDKLHSIEFGNKITLIYGKNSAGKSTLIQALKLIQQSSKYQHDLLLTIPAYESGGIKFPNYESLLPANNKEKILSLGIECKLSDSEDFSSKEIIRTIIKKYKKINDNLIIADKVELYAPSERKKDGTINTDKFLEIENSPIFPNSSKLKNLLEAKITFSGNEGVFFELYDLYCKNKDNVKEKFDEVINFTNKSWDTIKKIDKLEEKKNRTKSEDENLKALQQELDNAFTYKQNQFLPQLFPFNRKQQEDHLNFFKKKSLSLKEFVNYLSEDEKKIQKPIYSNNKLYLSFGEIRKLLISYDIHFEQDSEKVKKIYEKARSAQTTLKEFLCYSLSSLYTDFPSKEVLTFEKNSRKSISAREMFDACDSIIKPTLSKTKIFSGKVTLPESFLTTISEDNFIGYNYENLPVVLKSNLNLVNKYLKQFGFDFKLKLNEFPNAITTLSFQKKGFSVNVGNAGLGAENIVPTIVQSLASKGDVLYFEEPERRAHPKLQADLADLFTESTSKNNNQIIIETHSENLLLGILKNVREKKIKPEDIKIAYIYLENGKSNIQQIDIDDRGRFKQVWRDGFFTERLDLV